MADLSLMNGLRAEVIVGFYIGVKLALAPAPPVRPGHRIEERAIVLLRQLAPSRKLALEFWISLSLVHVSLRQKIKSRHTVLWNRLEG